MATTRNFFDRFLRVPVNRQLVPMTLHAAQVELLTAWDAVDVVTGLPRYSWCHADWPKKSGKSTNTAGIALADLVGGSEPDREIVVCANDYAQSRDVSYASIVKFAKRDPWLAKHLRVLSDTVVYKETVVDPATGGRHTQQHIIRAVPARDVRSLHGANPTLVIFDELWGFQNYDVIEALAPSPTRRVSRTLSSSYKGLRSQRREGFPLFDLLERWKAGSDPQLYVSSVSGPDCWKQIPWIRPSFIDQQRKAFAAVPAKFERLWLNQWSADDGSNFLSADEIRAAVDGTLTEPPQAEPGVSYSIGVDLGLTFDWSAVVVSHVGADHRLTVDAVRFWRGSRQTPVSLSRVEDEIVTLGERFNLRQRGRCVLDLWQSSLLRERLQRRLPGASIETVTVDPAHLDRMATGLKSVFASRLIRVPQHAELVEQLETIIGVEQKRRDLIRFTSGTGVEAGRHDDLVVALCLSMESQAEEIGRCRLPFSFSMCYRAASVPTFSQSDCFLLSRDGNYVPAGDPSCRACPGWQFTKQAYDDHCSRGGPRVGIREFRRSLIQDNDYTARMKFARWAENVGL